MGSKHANDSFFDLTKDDDKNDDQKQDANKSATTLSNDGVTDSPTRVMLRITEELKCPNASGVYPELQTRIAIEASSGSSSTYEYRLCKGCEIIYYEQNTDFTCSYASLMMIISALLSHHPEYRRSLFNGCNLVPDVVSIQRLIELSWRSGFDQEGRDHFRGKLVDKRERIGPSDIAGLMRSNGVPTLIYDFDYEPQDTFRSALALIENIFFTENEGSEFPIFPLIMGDAHHTIVIVGCRKHKPSGDVELLCFDPARKITRCLAASGIQGFLCRESRASQLQILQFGAKEDHPNLLLTEQSDVKFGGKTLFAIRPPRVSNMPKIKREKFSG